MSPRFLVVALGLPVPRYHGSSLDPPLRSRFAGRCVGGDEHLHWEEQVKELARVVKLWRQLGTVAEKWVG